MNKAQKVLLLKNGAIDQNCVFLKAFQKYIQKNHSSIK